MSDTTGDALALPTETTALPTETTALPTEIPTLPDEIPALPTEITASSPNTFGRPLGSRNRRTLEMESFLEGEVSAVRGKLLKLAMADNPTALRLCAERMMPRMKSLSINIEMPSIKAPADIGPALSAVLDAAACGQLDIDQVRGLAAVIETRRKSFETIELEERMTLIEKKISRDRRAI
jgi:hypothetical protein